MDNSIYNPQINWLQGHNDRPGVILDNYNKVQPGTSYSSNRSLDDLFQGDQEAINKAYPFVNQRYITYGSPNAGQIAA